MVNRTTNPQIDAEIGQKGCFAKVSGLAIALFSYQFYGFLFEFFLYVFVSFVSLNTSMSLYKS